MHSVLSENESSQPAVRRVRVDRERNRAAIVAAARAAFARADAAGIPLSMNEVARAANVGVATLYRHFPTRDSLAEAVYQVKLDEVTERVRRSTVDDDALATLQAWVREFATLMLSTRGMMDTLRSAWLSGSRIEATTTARIADVIASIVDAGRLDGTLRGDIDAMDVTVAVLALLSTTPPQGSGSRALRLLDLFIQGLAPRVAG